MRIIVVHPGNDWILSRLAREMVAAADGWSEFALQDWAPELQSIIPAAVYFVDAQCCWTPTVEARTRSAWPKVPMVGFYTHADRDDLGMVRPEIRRLDGVVHMCRRYRDRFLQAGWYSAERMTVIPPIHVRQFKMRRIRVGICQRGGFPGKGDPFLFEALAGLPEEILRHVALKIKGSGWSESLEKFRSGLVSLQVCLDEAEGHDSYESFYEDLDYLLVPSLWEGGPIAVAEALACGVPVLAANVGWVPELTTIGWDSGSRIPVPGCRTFPPGNAEALQMHITSLVHVRLDRRRQVDGYAWRGYAEKLEKFVETLR